MPTSASARACARARSRADGRARRACLAGQRRGCRPRGRYRAAERVRERLGLDRIATGHTASDQVETVLYRLVSSPGRRALLGMRRRNGRLIRPLLDLSTAADPRLLPGGGPRLARGRDQPRSDASRATGCGSTSCRRCGTIHPAADQNILATADQLSEEAERAGRSGRRGGRAGGGRGRRARARRRRGCDALPPALRRLVLRRLAEQAAGGPLPLSRRAGRRDRGAGQRRGGSASLDLGAGVSVSSEYGVLRFQRRPSEASPTPAPLPVPGRCRFGDWELVCELEAAEPAARGPGSPDEPLLDASRLPASSSVRGWRDGDRMRPLGLGGSEVAPGPLHRPQGAALAASPPAGRRVRAARSHGWRAWRSPIASG